MSHILWQNAERSITVIDGPQSIANAQGRALGQGSYGLASVQSISIPFPSQEPKSDAARTRLLQSSGINETHRPYVELLQHSLNEVKSSYRDVWNLPRFAPLASSKQSDAVEDDTEDSQVSSVANVTEGRSAHVVEELGKVTAAHNDHDGLALLNIEDRTYIMPAASSFMLMDCMNRQHITSLHAEIRRHASENDAPWKFDLMVVDPPWTNRSVKRKRKSYVTTADSGLKDMLLQMDLDRLMTPRCLLAIWITNKASARELALGEGGLFDVYGIDLAEEWIWLKVTDCGAPIRNIDSLWSRPYEILLIGRRRDLYEATATPPDEVTRRVLIGVPDIHSRKPCLEQLLATCFELPDDYRGLELFARHLVKGWWSVGNEAIKYNEAIHWQKTRFSTESS